MRLLITSTFIVTLSFHEQAAPEEEVIEPKEVPRIDELESLKSKETEVADSARDISIPAAERAEETSETNSPDVEPQTSEEPGK